MPLNRPEDIAELLTSTRTIALIGASERPDRPSNRVMKFLLNHGYRVIPVNPKCGSETIHGQPVVASLAETIHGQPVVASLAEIDERIDLVDIFRRPQAAGEAVDDAIAAGAKAVWMQIGVINEEAANRAEAAGLKVVMDRCPAIEIPRLGIPPVMERQAISGT